MQTGDKKKRTRRLADKKKWTRGLAHKTDIQTGKLAATKNKKRISRLAANRFFLDLVAIGDWVYM